MERVGIFFLHGFLGLPSDWRTTLEYLALPGQLNTYLVDYFNIPELNPKVQLEDWAAAFNHFVEGKGNQINYLVGYSQGGRLGLHALAQKPSLWKRSFFISTNPGFADDLQGFDESSEERSKRWLNDTYWSEQFRVGAWQNVIKAWNAQPIFGKSVNESPREENHFSREMLSLALTQWSLAQQINMRKIIHEQVEHLTWIVGAKDKKYLKIGEELHQIVPALDYHVIDQASHRVLADNPGDLAKIIRPFLI